jgi:hypothetical protein
MVAEIRVLLNVGLERRSLFRGGEGAAAGRELREIQ